MRGVARRPRDDGGLLGERRARCPSSLNPYTDRQADQATGLTHLVAVASGPVAAFFAVRACIASRSNRTRPPMPCANLSAVLGSQPCSAHRRAARSTRSLFRSAVGPTEGPCVAVTSASIDRGVVLCAGQLDRPQGPLGRLETTADVRLPRKRGADAKRRVGVGVFDGPGVRGAQVVPPVVELGEGP